mgnify:CR=1 FL=1
MDICPKCGLPKQACVCDEIAKSTQRIKVYTVKRKFGKISTVVSGFDKGIDIKSLAKTLKNELACGGTTRDNEIELQGNHSRKVKPILVSLGFDENSIED